MCDVFRPFDRKTAAFLLKILKNDKKKQRKLDIPNNMHLQKTQNISKLHFPII